MSTTDPIFSRIIDERSPAGATKIRQSLIRKIQDLTGRKLIVYTASITHPMAGIIQQDIPLFEDLLRFSPDIIVGDLMINSPGGDPNAAEKILMMCRERFSAEFNVIVPNYAKSAAAMIALGADRIYMGYLAELGPIDPQIPIVLPTGQVQLIPARAYIGGLDSIRDRILKRREPVQIFLPILSQIRPDVLKFCEDAIDNSREFAEKWLKMGMLKNDPQQAEKVAKELATGEKYKTHGKVINFKEANDELKLNVELIDNQSELWHLIWELYLRSIQALQDTPGGMGAKLFESDSSSVTMNIQVVPQVPAPQPPSHMPKE